MSAKDQTTVLNIRMSVRVPGVHDPATIAELVGRLHCEGQNACNDILADPDLSDAYSDARTAKSMRFAMLECSLDHIDGPDCDVDVDWDEASYVGDGEDGVYYQVFEDSKGDYWWSTSVDCNTGGFCDGMTTGAGPYPDASAAELSARSEAEGWCIDNLIAFDGDCDD